MTNDIQKFPDRSAHHRANSYRADFVGSHLDSQVGVANGRKTGTGNQTPDRLSLSGNCDSQHRDNGVSTGDSEPTASGKVDETTKIKTDDSATVRGSSRALRRVDDLGDDDDAVGCLPNQITPAITPAITSSNTSITPIAQDVDSNGDNFRLELEFIEQKSGVVVKLRERARFTFDGKRPSNILGVFACGSLTKRQLSALRNKTLPPGVKAALAEGDISYEVLEIIFARPGKGATRAARNAGKAFRQNKA